MRSLLPSPGRRCAAASVIFLSLAAVAAAQPNAPIAVAVTSSLAGQKGLGRILSSAGSGNTDASARDVESLLLRMRWARVVSSQPEVLVSISNRERVERRRSTDKDGRVSIDHRYTVYGAVEVGRSRSTVQAEQDFTEGPYSTRHDDEQFRKAAEKLVGEITRVVYLSLDELRPDRLQSGFAFTPKYKLLFKGDGLEVTAVEPGSPAERAGLQVRDRIRRIDAEKGTDQMAARVLTWWVEAPGTRVSLEYERNKQRQTVELTLLPRGDWASGGPPANPYAASAPSRPAPAAAPPSGGSSFSGSSSRPAASGSQVELKPGMTEQQVLRLLGQPKEKVAFGAKSLWRYDGYSLTFQDGKVIDMK